MLDSAPPPVLPAKGPRSPAPASTPSSASSLYTSTTPAEDADDIETPTSGSLQDGSFKKTRRGKRAGKNLKMRNAESELRRMSSDIRRGAVDLHRNSFESQAVRLVSGMARTLLSLRLKRTMLVTALINL